MKLIDILMDHDREHLSGGGGGTPGHLFLGVPKTNCWGAFGGLVLGRNKTLGGPHLYIYLSLCLYLPSSKEHHLICNMTWRRTTIIKSGEISGI